MMSTETTAITEVDKAKEQVAEAKKDAKTAVRVIAEAVNAQFSETEGYGEFVRNVYDALMFPLDDVWIEAAGVARDIPVELEYEVYCSSYTSLNGEMIDLDGSLGNVQVSATLYDVPAYIDDLTQIDEIGDYNPDGWAQEIEQLEGDLNLTFTLVNVEER